MIFDVRDARWVPHCRSDGKGIVVWDCELDREIWDCIYADTALGLARKCERDADGHFVIDRIAGGVEQTDVFTQVELRWRGTGKKLEREPWL